MPTVELPDDLIAALSKEARARSYGDVATFLETMVRRHLAETPAQDLARDRLTGCLMRHELWEHIHRSTWIQPTDNRVKYRERFLCVDIDDFKGYLDMQGLLAGDAVLQAVARDLQSRFGSSSVYRIGGDDFVVILGERPAWIPETPSGIRLKHSVVDVDISPCQDRNHHINNWIVHHVQAGLLLGRFEGARLECRDPHCLVNE